MSWLSDSSVLTKQDMQNMQSGGREDWNWESLGYIMHHSLVRKRYSTVRKSTTIPGRIGLLMFACYSRSVCTACVNSLMTYHVCANRVRRCMQIHTLTGSQLKRSDEHFLVLHLPQNI